MTAGRAGPCPARCCPHAADAAGCPLDLPGAQLAERVVHLYACQGMSARRIAELTTAGRQRIARLLREAGVRLPPRGAGRRRPARTAGEVPAGLLADLYLREMLTCAQICELTGIPARTVRDRLVADGVRMRTRGRFNREDRADVPASLLTAMYVRDELPADEIGSALGVSRRIVLRAAHDHGLPVRVGGPPPASGPAEVELVEALYADVAVRRTLLRHGIPRVPPGGPIWQRFPAPARVSTELATDLYAGCGLAVTHIELLTGQPADTIRRVLREAGVTLRPAGGRSPFLRRWRGGCQDARDPVAQAFPQGLPTGVTRFTMRL